MSQMYRWVDGGVDYGWVDGWIHGFSGAYKVYPVTLLWGERMTIIHSCTLFLLLALMVPGLMS